MAKLYMVRHGKTDWNNQGIIQGITDIPLNEEGIEQVHELAQKINVDNFDLCIASPLIRAKQTAEILVGNQKEIILDGLLVERGFGKLEGTEFNLDDFTKYWDLTLNDDSYGVETINQCMQRAEVFLAKIKREYPNKNILIVSHGCFIKALHFCLAGYDENTDFLSFHAQNSTLYEYEI